MADELNDQFTGCRVQDELPTDEDKPEMMSATKVWLEKNAHQAAAGID